MSTSPEPQQTGTLEFNDEQNRTFSDLADSMSVVANLMKILAIVLLVACGLIIYKVVAVSAGWPAMVLLGVGTLGILTLGFWTGSAASSFRRITESKNRDVWHLMNALGKLNSMYSLMRTLVQLGLVVAALAAAFAAYEAFVKTNP